MSFYLGPSIKIATVDFAKKAHAYFTANPTSHTFTEGDVSIGVLFAVRWAFDKDHVHSVLVFEVGSTLVLVEEF